MKMICDWAGLMPIDSGIRTRGICVATQFSDTQPCQSVEHRHHPYPEKEPTAINLNVYLTQLNKSFDATAIITVDKILVDPYISS